MSLVERERSIVATIFQARSLKELLALLPPSFTERLGEGERGKLQALGLLTSLSIFPPAPHIVTYEMFDTLVAKDYSNNRSLKRFERHGMFLTALEARLITLLPSSMEEFTVDPGVREQMIQLHGSDTSSTSSKLSSTTDFDAVI